MLIYFFLLQNFFFASKGHVWIIGMITCCIFKGMGAMFFILLNISIIISMDLWYAKKIFNEIRSCQSHFARCGRVKKNVCMVVFCLIIDVLYFFLFQEKIKKKMLLILAGQKDYEDNNENTFNLHWIYLFFLRLFFPLSWLHHLKIFSMLNWMAYILYTLFYGLS